MTLEMMKDYLHKKSLCLASITAAVIFMIVGAGCNNKTATGTDSSSTNTPQQSQSSPQSAPIDYVGAVGQAYRHSQKVIDLVQIQNAIKQFQAVEGRNPISLQELVQQGYLPNLPQPPPGTQILYEPRTGSVKIVPINR